MDVLMSNWTEVQTLPESYVFPHDRRPGKLVFPVCENIPVIDLQKAQGNGRAEFVQQILQASQDFGFFQVINHGVSQGLMEETMSVMKEFFSMSPEYKAKFYSNDINKSCRIFSSTFDYEKENFHYWRDNFTHLCHPLEDHIQSWPENPLKYREVTGEYCVEVRKLMLRILGLMGKGLGIDDEEDYFKDKLTKTQKCSANHHIPCPDPSMTIGMPEHYDPNLITIIHQNDVPGFQVFKNGEWLGIDHIPNAFLVIPALQLKVISNDLFKSPKHRVVTNSKEARTTISTFLSPSNDSLIEPVKALVNAGDSPVYRPFTYQDFFTNFKGRNAEIVLESFKNIIKSA